MFRASFESGVSHSRLLSLLSLLSHEVQETAMDNATSEQAFACCSNVCWGTIWPPESHIGWAKIWLFIPCFPRKPGSRRKSCNGSPICGKICPFILLRTAWNLGLPLACSVARSQDVLSQTSWERVVMLAVLCFIHKAADTYWLIGNWPGEEPSVSETGMGCKKGHQ